MRDRRGFTLLEILVVLGLAALVVGLVLSRLEGSLDGLRVRTASRQVAALLRGARLQAIARRQPVTVTLGPRGAAIRGGAAGAPATPGVVVLPDGVGLVVFDEGNRPRSDRVTVIGFSPRGTSSGGLVGVSGGKRLIPIAVDAYTGRVTVLEAAP